MKELGEDLLGPRRLPAALAHATTRGSVVARDRPGEAEHTRTHEDLEWFGPPERNTLRPLRVVLLVWSVDESILCL